MGLHDLGFGLADIPSWSAALFLLFGLALCFVGRYFIRLVVVISVFVPVSLTVYTLAVDLGGLDSETAKWSAAGLGLVFGLYAAKMYKRIHIILGGIFGLIILSMLMKVVEPFYELNSIVSLIIMDGGFIIGARVFRNWKDELNFAAPSAIGGVTIAAGWYLFNSAVGLSGFNPFDRTNSIILFAGLMGGSFFQMWLFGEGGYLEQRRGLVYEDPIADPDASGRRKQDKEDKARFKAEQEKRSDRSQKTGVDSEEMVDYTSMLRRR